MKVCYLVTIIICLYINISAYSQPHLGVKLILLSSHLLPYTYQLGKFYPRKIDNKGQFVWIPGIEIFWEQDKPINQINSRFLRYSVAIYKDCLDQYAGYIAVSFRWVHQFRDQLRINWGIGPTLVWRQSWSQFTFYRNDGFFRDGNNFEFRELVAGDVDIEYLYQDKVGWSLSIVPTIPFTVTQSLGL